MCYRKDKKILEWEKNSLVYCHMSQTLKHRLLYTNSWVDGF